MVAFSRIGAGLACVSVVAGAVPRVRQKRGFSVHQTSVENDPTRKYDMEDTVEVAVGRTPKPVKLVFDTASSDL